MEVPCPQGLIHGTPRHRFNTPEGEWFRWSELQKPSEWVPMPSLIGFADRYGESVLGSFFEGEGEGNDTALEAVMSLLRLVLRSRR